MKTISKILIKKIHEQLFPEKAFSVANDNFDICLEAIEKIHPELSKLLTAFQATEQQIKFFKTDKEMKIKFPDVWQMQLDQEENQLKTLTNKLKAFGEIKQLKIADFIDHENNKFNDLFKQ